MARSSGMLCLASSVAVIILNAKYLVEVLGKNEELLTSFISDSTELLLKVKKG